MQESRIEADLGNKDVRQAEEVAQTLSWVTVTSGKPFHPGFLNGGRNIMISKEPGSTIF